MGLGGGLFSRKVAGGKRRCEVGKEGDLRDGGMWQQSELSLEVEGCCAPGALTRVAVPVPFSALL